MITEERFNEIANELESRGLYPCGYWNVCDDHACACVLSNKDFDAEIYKKMQEDNLKELELEFDYFDEDYIDYDNTYDEESEDDYFYEDDTCMTISDNDYCIVCGREEKPLLEQTNDNLYECKQCRCIYEKIEENLYKLITE